MIDVSPAYQTAIKENVRKFTPKVEITWTDPTIDETVDGSSNDDNYTSYPEQAADTQNNPTYKWFHFDGVCKFDGSYHIAPGESLKNQYQVGWWGATRCDGNAEWSGTYPTLTIEFEERPILSLVVVGDSQYNEYPVDFDIEIYDSSDTLLHSVSVTGNTELSWNQSISEVGISTATYMKLIVKKWSKANRVVKILEFYTSLVETYTGDDIVSMKLLEEREIGDGSLPIGNISANELDLSLQNICIQKGSTKIIDPFFPSNPNTFLKSLIKRNRKIRAWIGLNLPDESIEYIPLGTFWSGDWNAPEQETTIQTSARDRMELLRNATCKTMPNYENISVYDLISNLLINAKNNIPMPDLIYEIDTALQDIIIPFAFFDRQSYFKCIKDIVTACMGVAYMSRDDVLIITGQTNYTRPGSVTTEGA